MALKRRTREDVYRVALQRLNDMAKATLLEPECPAVDRTSFGSTFGHRCRREARVRRLPASRSDRRAMRTERIQGHEQGAYVVLGRFSMTEHGMTYRTRVPGSRSRNSSRGSNAPPGNAVPPRTGRSATGNCDGKAS